MITNTNNIIKRIKQRREELGYSFQDLADKTGMSKSTLQRYESGAIKNVPLDKLDDLAKALKVSPTYLMGWEEEIKEQKETPQSKMTVMARNFEKLDEKDKNIVLKLIETMINEEDDNPYKK